MKDYWYDKVEVTVYLCGTTSTSANCAGKEVTAGAARPARQGPADDARRSRRSSTSRKQRPTSASRSSSRTPRTSSTTSAPDALPESYRVKLKDPKQFDVVATAFQDRPGVDTVQDLKKLLDPVFKVLDGAAARSPWSSRASAASRPILLISNTIRVAAFSRRRETGIMRLVGASNLYIQLPFLLEGALAGLVGRVLACGLVAAGQVRARGPGAGPHAQVHQLHRLGRRRTPSIPVLLLIGCGPVQPGLLRHAAPPPAGLTAADGRPRLPGRDARPH